jgi:hypothetical protein
MNKKENIRIPARILLWLGGALCGIAVQNAAAWALTVSFLATISALLALHFCEDAAPLSS